MAREIPCDSHSSASIINDDYEQSQINADADEKSAEVDFDEDTRRLWVEYFGMCLLGVMISSLLFVLQGFSWRHPAGLRAVIPAAWKNSRSADEMSPAAVASAVVAIPVMLFVASALVDMNAGERRSGENAGGRSSYRSYRAVTRRIFQFSYLFASIACWTLVPPAIRSPHPISNVLCAVGGAMLATAFFQLDDGNDDLRHLTQHQVARRGKRVCAELKDLDIGRFGDTSKRTKWGAPLGPALWAAASFVVLFVCLIIDLVKFDDATRSSSTVTHESWVVLVSEFFLSLAVLFVVTEIAILGSSFATIRLVTYVMAERRQEPRRRGAVILRTLGLVLAVAFGLMISLGVYGITAYLHHLCITAVALAFLTIVWLTWSCVRAVRTYAAERRNLLSADLMRILDQMLNICRRQLVDESSIREFKVFVSGLDDEHLGYLLQKLTTSRNGRKLDDELRRELMGIA